jgi:hypothetical protein
LTGVHESREPVDPPALARQARGIATLRDEMGLDQRRPRGFADPDLRRAIEMLESIVDQPDIPEDALAEFFHVAPAPGKSFAAGIRLREEIASKLGAADAKSSPSLLENANDFARWRRRHIFRKRLGAGDRSPMLLAEGDSWFHFPIFLRDIVLQLSADHLIWPLGAAGETLDHMVFGRGEGQGPNYLNALSEFGASARAFLFSGGGNDLIGEDEDGSSALMKFVRRFEAGRSAAWHLDTPEFKRRLVHYEAAHRHMIVDVAARQPNLPIVLHAYDYVLPCPFGRRDRRHPHRIARDKYFGAMFPLLGIVDAGLQAEILRNVVDAMNGVLRRLAGGNVAGGSFAQVFHVDLRGALGFDDWADELHPTNAGYAKLSERFRRVLRHAAIA